MKTKKYLIDWNPTTLLLDGRRGVVEVEGEPVKFKGYEAFEFFVAQRPDKLWSVAEISTGQNISTGPHTSRKEAVKQAEANLLVSTPKKFAAMVRRAHRVRKPELLSGVIAKQRGASRPSAPAETNDA